MVNRQTNFYQNSHFCQKFTGLKFDFGSTSTNESWWPVLQSSSWWLIMMTGHFVKILFLIEFWSKIKSTGNFYVLGGKFYRNSNKCVYSVFNFHPLCSVHSTNSVGYHIKHSYRVFRKVLSKDFTSDQPQDRWVDFKSGVVTWESQNPYPTREG